MYCSLGQNQFFDDAGAPLSAGRVKIYAKGIDTLLPIYVDNGDSMVPTQNPVITANDGRIPTIFWTAAIVDVVVEKSNGDGTYKELDSYVAGLDLASVEAVQGVGSITALRSIAPSENMVVQVNGYYTAGDSPTRKYLWVAGAANTDDGGYVIRSNSDNGGRWVMLWEGERLPASLYGVLCGHSGYARKENIGNLFDVGKSVTVANLVFIPTPEVIEFDGCTAAGGSDMSPITYGLDGQRLVTIHRIAVAAVNKTLTTTSLCQIHCSGLRGESWTNAEWLIDQNWNTNDQMERISTLWFNGNTQAMHDAFMACVGCAKVKTVELYNNSLYPLLINTDAIANKLIIDYSCTDQAPAYTYSSSVVYLALNGHVLIGARLSADYIESLGNLIVYGMANIEGIINASGKIKSNSDIQSNGDLIFNDGIKFKDDNGRCMVNPNDDSYYPHSPKFPHGLYIVGALNATTLEDSLRKMHVNVSTSGAMSVNLTSDSTVAGMTAFYCSKYKINDIVIVSNTGSGALSVIAVSGVLTVVLNAHESCAFIKVGDHSWNKMAPS